MRRKQALIEELLIKETYKKEVTNGTKKRKGKTTPLISTMMLVELHLIQTYAGVSAENIQVESENILDYFLQPEFKNLGEKIIDAYKLLGFIDIGVILSANENASLRERIFQSMMKALPADDTMMEKIFTDNVRQIKEKMV